MKTLVAAVFAALGGAGLLAAGAGAHIDVRPGLLEAGAEMELLVELPELRPGEPPTTLTVEGVGVRQISSEPAGGVGQETQWDVRVAVDAAPGPAELRLIASFADGESVEVRRAVTVVPAADDDGTPIAALVAAVVALAALVGAAVVLRRRPPRTVDASGRKAVLRASVGGAVLFQQFLDEDLGCAAYLVGDEDAGVAAVVDPPFAVEPLLAAADRHGVRIVRCIETHTHADHLSGHGRLALEHGVPVSIHPAAEATYPHDDLEDGTELELGLVTVRAIHTPGHRPEHTCLAVADRSRAAETWLVLTGDSLFVGDAARPDLAVGAQDGATALYGSLQRLLALGDGVEVFPGHVAGSLCGKGMSSKASSTIGFERRYNAALQLADELAFVTDRAGVSTPKPPNMTLLVELNRGSFVGAAAPVDELGAAPNGATVLDVRPVADFLSGHLAGALSVPVDGGSFATKAGFVLEPDAAIVVAAASAGEAQRAVRSLHAVGFLEVAGYVLGGGPERIEPVPIDDLEALLAGGADLLDVREREERDNGYIPGSRNVPYRLLAVAGADVSPDGSVITICETGARAGIAASMLAARGVDARPVVDGGVATWIARGGRAVEFRRCGT